MAEDSVPAVFLDLESEVMSEEELPSHDVKVPINKLLQEPDDDDDDDAENVQQPEVQEDDEEEEGDGDDESGSDVQSDNSNVEEDDVPRDDDENIVDYAHRVIAETLNERETCDNDDGGEVPDEELDVVAVIDSLIDDLSQAHAGDGGDDLDVWESFLHAPAVHALLPHTKYIDSEYSNLLEKYAMERALEMDNADGHHDAQLDALSAWRELSEPGFSLVAVPEAELELVKQAFSMLFFGAPKTKITNTSSPVVLPNLQPENACGFLPIQTLGQHYDDGDMLEPPPEDAEDIEVLYLPVFRRVCHTGLEESAVCEYDEYEYEYEYDDDYEYEYEYEYDEYEYEYEYEYDEQDACIKPQTLVANRYRITRLLGKAAFSDAVGSVDLKTGREVCLKIIKNKKEFFDCGVDEIRVHRMLARFLSTYKWPSHHIPILTMHDYFYYKEHIIIVTELLGRNLYEYAKVMSLRAVRHIAHQVLQGLDYAHSLGIIHADLKPENILVVSSAKDGDDVVDIKIIDFGSACFANDRQSCYIQSRSYRAVEVMLNLPYTTAIDMWSLGCILVELVSGFVLFPNLSIPSIMARIIGLIGPIPEHMINSSWTSESFFVAKRYLLDKQPLEAHGEPVDVFLCPKKFVDDHLFLDLVSKMLTIDPKARITAREALQHPFFISEH